MQLRSIFVIFFNVQTERNQLNLQIRDSYSLLSKISVYRC